MNIQESETDMKEYKALFFQEIGYDTLLNYCKGLIIEYMNREGYPYELSPVLGVPLFHYSTHIKSGDEMLGRIKILCQILGIKEIAFTYEGRLISFDPNGTFEL